MLSDSRYDEAHSHCIYATLTVALVHNPMSSSRGREVLNTAELLAMIVGHYRGEDVDFDINVSPLRKIQNGTTEF